MAPWLGSGGMRSCLIRSLNLRLGLIFPSKEARTATVCTAAVLAWSRFLGASSVVSTESLMNRSVGVGIHRGEREEVTRRARRDDVGNISGGQGDGAAWADEPLDLVAVKQLVDQAGGEALRLGAERASSSAASLAAGTDAAATVSETVTTAEAEAKPVTTVAAASVASSATAGTAAVTRAKAEAAVAVTTRLAAIKTAARAVGNPLRRDNRTLRSRGPLLAGDDGRGMAVPVTATDSRAESKTAAE